MRISQQIPLSNMSLDINKGQPTTNNFSEHMMTAIDDVNSKLHQADHATELLVRGEIDFHNAMIITEKANLALQLTMAIRNKVIESYQEIMRMQV